VQYTVNVPTAAAAAQVSTLVTSGTATSTAGTAPLTTTLVRAGVPVTSVSPAVPPTVATTEC
jgi:hypothetical protein